MAEDRSGNNPNAVSAVDRSRFKSLWDRAKKEDYSGLDDDQRRIAEALRLHADDYSEIFDAPDVLDQIAFDPEEDVNPFSHISLHAAVASQMENRDPPEVCRFYDAMRKKGLSHHDAVHLIGAILVPLIAATMKWLIPFDAERYAARLGAFTAHAPEEIWQILEQENDHEDDRLAPLFSDEDGECGRCGTSGPLDENGLCEACADMWERDLIRGRKWEKSTLAAYSRPEDHEALRKQVIEQFGKDMEF